MTEMEHTDQHIEDAAVVALLRRLETAGIARAVLADLSDAEQAAVFASEARITRGRK